MGCGPTHNPRWATLLFTVGDPDGADPARCVPSGLSASGRADRLDHQSAGPDVARAGPHDTSRRSATLAVPRPQTNNDERPASVHNPCICWSIAPD